MSPAGTRAARGYTLVELVVVMALLGVLATLVAPLAEITEQRSRERELKRALLQIRDAIDAYHAAALAGGIVVPEGGTGYPPTLQALVAGVPSARERGRTVYLLRSVPRDPFADPRLPAEATWALRSYQSPPDKPQPGLDVYDVASRSDRVGLNGVPLREW